MFGAFQAANLTGFLVIVSSINCFFSSVQYPYL